MRTIGITRHEMPSYANRNRSPNAQLVINVIKDAQFVPIANVLYSNKWFIGCEIDQSKLNNPEQI